MSRKKLASILPWRENEGSRPTFSISQISRIKLASILPWRENEGSRPTFSISQMSRMKLASILPWRENEGRRPTSTPTLRLSEGRVTLASTLPSVSREGRKPTVAQSHCNCCLITLQLLPNHRPSIAQSLTNRATVAMLLGNTCSTRRKWPHLHTHCRVCLELTRTLLVTAI